MNIASADSLNPSAGTHPVTSDPDEVAAVRRAGDRSYADFPYYEARYGDRGRLFAVSDGAWLLTVCRLPWQALEEEILWLGGLLASRGMPRLLLERHLRVMLEELAHLERSGHGWYDGLIRAADHLRELRRARISDQALRHLAAEFEARVNRAGRAPIPRFGEILVAAVADEADDVDLAVFSIEGWCTDASRFPTEWIDAVRSTLAAARYAVSTPEPSPPAGPVPPL